MIRFETLFEENKHLIEDLWHSGNSVARVWDKTRAERDRQKYHAIISKEEPVTVDASVVSFSTAELIDDETGYEFTAYLANGHIFRIYA